MKRMWLRLCGALFVFTLLAAACGDDDDADDADGAADGAAEDGAGGDETCGNPDGSLKVALLIPGVRNDNSFSQAGYEGLIEAAAADGDVSCTILEEIVDPTDSLPALRDFASQGYDLVIGHGIEYVDPIQELYSEFPDVNFAMSGGVLVDGAVTADNLEDWLYNLQDMAYPNGIIAANALVGETIGVVGGPEFDFVKNGHAAFREAVRSVNPDVEFLEGFAGSFTDPAAAAEVTASLIDQGADYIYCSGDGICIGAAQSAAAAGIPISVGFGSQEQTAPDEYISASVLELSGQYQSWFDEVRADTFGTPDGQTHVPADGDAYAFNPGGIFNGQVIIPPLNTGATVELAMSIDELQAILDELVAQIEAGEFEVPFPSPDS